MTPSFRPALPGTGSLRAPRAASWTPPLAAALLAGVLAQVGCSPDLKDGLGPRVPVPNVTGRVERDGVAASGIDVSVRDPRDDSTIADAKTDADGSYVVVAPAGVWEVKAKGKILGDFASVTRGFIVTNVGQQVSMDSLDIFAYEAALVAPSDAATLGLPTGPDPVTFRWSPPRHAILSARAQLYNASGEAVWFSAKSSDSSAVWDGVGNQGSFTGSGLPEGAYTWRVKFDLPDSSEARTPSWRLSFQ